MSTTKLPSLEEMARIPHTDLPERLDEMFERIEKEDIAFVITENGEDKYVLCPYAWFDFARDDDFGCMVNSAESSKSTRTASWISSSVVDTWSKNIFD